MSGDYHFSNHWKRERQALLDQRASGKAHISTKNRRVQVNAPFNEDFRKGALELSGNYRDRTQIWSFRIQSMRLVIELAERIFGEDNVIVGR